MVRIYKKERKYNRINKFNLNKGGVLKSNYNRITEIYITGTKKYLHIYVPEYQGFWF